MLNHVTYPLSKRGAVRNWLGCGPFTSPIEGLEAVVDATGSPFGKNGRWTLNYWAWHADVQTMKSRIYTFLDPPLELFDTEPLPAQPSHEGAVWRYLSLEEDTADFSRFSFVPTLFSGHLYAEVNCDAPGPRQVELLTIGPAHIWLQGRHVYSYREPFGYVHTHTVPVTLNLKAGTNRLWLRGDMIGLREARLALGLRFLDSTGLGVRLPIGALSLSQWRAAERGLNAIVVSRYAFPHHDVTATLAAGGSDPFAFTVHAELPPFESEDVRCTVKPGETFSLPLTEQTLEAVAQTPGEASLQFVFRPANGMPLERRLEVFLGSASYSHAPYGTYDSRRNEAVAHLARMTSDVMGAVAAVRVGHNQSITSETVDTAVRFLNERRDTADF